MGIINLEAVPHRAAGEAHTDRLTFRFFFHELQHYLHLEKGLLHTFVDLLGRPGLLLRGYFDGTHRREYTNPIAYILLAAAASLLSFSTYREAFTAWMRSGMGMPPVAGAPDAFLKAYMENLLAVSQRTAVTSTLLAIPLALFLWLLFRSPRFNLAESFAFALYATGTYLFVYALGLGPVIYATENWTLAQYGGLLLQVVVPLWLGLKLFGSTITNGMKLLVAAGLSALVGYVMIALAMLAYTALTWR